MSDTKNIRLLESIQHDTWLLDCYNEMMQHVPSFDYDKHYLITIEDDSGNIMELIGVALYESATKTALRAGYKRLKNYDKERFSVGLRHGGRHMSYVC
jgi:hypothetical protein